MLKKRYTHLLFLVSIVLLAFISACQKDNAVANPSASKSNADTAIVSLSGNFLAASGTLKIKFKDSVYTFDAAKDSIAFINLSGADQNRYFGITAINKAHTLSFGISSEGFAFSNVNRSVAGSQLLFTGDLQNQGQQLSLRKNVSPINLGEFNLQEYHTDNELAKGTFYTFLSTDENNNSPYYRVDGSFDLKLK